VKIRKRLSGKLGKLAKEVQHTFTKIRLFTRGKGEKAIVQKKKLSQDLEKTVSRMRRLVQEKVNGLKGKAKKQYQEVLDFYGLMLSQIRHWMKTGFHRPGKIVSLWEKQARAITRNKAAKAVEFGRRWIITRLEKGYIIGTPCRKLGGDADTSILPEVLEHFERILGEKPRMAVYDRGGDGPKNHETLACKNIRNAIFRKGKESLVGLGRNTVLKARRERALSEASIATIKNPRYGFNKPRAKSSEGCVLKGQAAILGANLTRLARDWTQAAVMA
jgi:IS5 family transposase